MLKDLQTLELGGVDKKCVYTRNTCSRFLMYEGVILMHVQHSAKLYLNRRDQFNLTNQTELFASLCI